MGSSVVVYRGISNPVILETYTCREVLALAEDLHVKEMKVASDCPGVVNDINQGTGGPHSAIIHEIIGYRTSFPLCFFVHERRKHNFEAHNLTKLACNLGIDRHVWLGNPHDPNLVPMVLLSINKVARFLRKKY